MLIIIYLGHLHLLYFCHDNLASILVIYLPLQYLYVGLHELEDTLIILFR